MKSVKLAQNIFKVFNASDYKDLMQFRIR